MHIALRCPTRKRSVGFFEELLRNSSRVSTLMGLDIARRIYRLSDQECCPARPRRGGRATPSRARRGENRIIWINQLVMSR